MDVGGQRHVPTALPFWKETRCPLYGSLGGSQARSGCVRKSLAPPQFDSRTVQSVASRHPVPHESHFLKVELAECHIFHRQEQIFVRHVLLSLALHEMMVLGRKMWHRGSL